MNAFLRGFGYLIFIAVCAGALWIIYLSLDEFSYSAYLPQCEIPALVGEVLKMQEAARLAAPECATSTIP